MALNRLQKGLNIYLACLFIFWLVLLATGYKTSNYNYFYSFAFSLVPLIGGMIGLWGARAWGGFKSILGKAVSLYSIGLTSWGAGSMVWSYYNFFAKVSAPYPSIADIGFALAVVFWVFGAIYLSRASGVKFGLRQRGRKLLAVLVPLAIAVGSYFLLVKVARQGILLTDATSKLKILLDVTYPMGDLVILTLSLVILGLSFKFLGGRYKASLVALLAGLAFMYVADFVFSYTTTTGAFYNGDWGDLIFTVALGLLTFGVLGFAGGPKQLQQPPTSKSEG